MRLPPSALLLVLAIALVSPHPAHAAWPNSPFTNLPVCVVPNDQAGPRIIADGAGGAIITWYDSRSGDYDVYAQHVLASGAVDPAWPVNGRALCTATNSQYNPSIASDGAGGAIVAWTDYRTLGVADIYAQHVRANGTVDPAWPADGRALCQAINAQVSPSIVADGAGGAIVAWEDDRTGSGDIYAQHVLASGAVDGAWPGDGRALCTAAQDQVSPLIVTDGAGGAIAVWNDGRNGGANTDIYAQRVLASGTVDPAWPVNGRGVCTAVNNQSFAAIVSDDAGGAIITWQDARGGGLDVYAQHVLSNGIADVGWPPDGQAISTALNSQASPTITTDGAGGAIIAWYDFRNANDDIFAQHVQESGLVDPAWPANGRGICTNGGEQFFPTITGDGFGGAIITW